MSKTLIPAAGYLRMSSDKQDTSIDGQRTELLDYAAKHGYRIDFWYADEGIAGWKNKQRQGFHRLIADAKDGGFKVILCWDQSRFSRFDPMEANYFWHQLRQVGVTLETIKEGKLDFESLGGWLSMSVQQHAKAEYCKSLAHDVVRGRKRQIMAGKWLSPAPYGYRLDKSIGTLVFGDASKIEIVRRIFAMRAKSMGFRSIALLLNKEGIQTPSGARWTATQIKRMTYRKTYCGHMAIGERPSGKFAHVTEEVQVFQNTHPAIIDPDLWQRVQAVNAGRRDSFDHGRRPSATTRLSGLLRCGRCGRTMLYDRAHDRYICTAYQTSQGCSHNTLAHDVALRLVVSKIRSVVLMGSVDRLTAAIEKELAKRNAARNNPDGAAIKRQIVAIDRKLEAAADRLLGVEDSLVGTVQAAMAKLKAQKDALAAQLEVTPKARPALYAQQVAAQLWTLDEVLQRGDVATVRNALGEMIDRVDIHFKSHPMPYGALGVSVGGYAAG